MVQKVMKESKTMTTKYKDAKTRQVDQRSLVQPRMIRHSKNNTREAWIQKIGLPKKRSRQPANVYKQVNTKRGDNAQNCVCIWSYRVLA